MWKNIESAPDDGTDVWVAKRLMDCVGCPWVYEVAYRKEYPGRDMAWYLRFDGSEFGEWTHWQEIIPPDDGLGEHPDCTITVIEVE